MFIQQKTESPLLILLKFPMYLANKIARFPVQAPIGAWLGLGTQHCYEAHSDRVETVKMQ